MSVIPLVPGVAGMLVDAARGGEQVGSLGRSTLGSRSLEQQASDLVPLNDNKARVTLHSESVKLDIDLTGRSHAGTPTPHVKESPRNTQSPEHLGRLYNSGKATTRPAGQQDIRTVRRYLERQ